MLRLPDEVASDGAAQFQLVTDAQFIDKVGRDFPVIKPFDGERHVLRLFRWRGNRIAALSLVAVFGGQAHIHVLTGSMPLPVGDGQRDALRPRRFFLRGHHFTQLPALVVQYRSSFHGSP